MQDIYGREIDYLRVSITDRCNFRCSYCMPQEGIRLIKHDQILSYEEMLRVIKVLGQYGVNKIRLTGGEPLIRKGIVEFIRCIKKIGTVKDLAITTNGSLLAPMASELKSAGLDRVNISIDTLNPDRFAAITGTGKLAETLSGVKQAVEAGLAPVKLNVVSTEALTRDDVTLFINEVFAKPLIVRFIEYMPIGGSNVKSGLTIENIKAIINTSGYGALEPATVEKGNGPARYYRLPGMSGVFGFITPMSQHFCHSCSRIRLTADGRIKPCLLGNCEINIKEALRNGSSDQIIKDLFVKALELKPQAHKVGTSGQSMITREMFQVGG